MFFGDIQKPHVLETIAKSINDSDDNNKKKSALLEKVSEMNVSLESSLLEIKPDLLKLINIYYNVKRL